MKLLLSTGQSQIPTALFLAWHLSHKLLTNALPTPPKVWILKPIAISKTAFPGSAHTSDHISSTVSCSVVIARLEPFSAWGETQTLKCCGLKVIAITATGDKSSKPDMGDKSNKSSKSDRSMPLYKSTNRNSQDKWPIIILRFSCVCVWCVLALWKWNIWGAGLDWWRMHNLCTYCTWYLQGMITSGRTLGCNRGAAAVVDAIVKQQLKWTQSGRSGGVQIIFAGLDYWTHPKCSYSMPVEYIHN